MKLRHTLTAFTAALSLSACATVPQYTSGADYLSRHNDQDVIVSSSGTDASIREIAAVEPDLRFPARIGLARIERGQLVSVPADEAVHWSEAASTLGAEFGQFVPVSPLIADMVDPANYREPRNVVDHIRKGSARQHLDYVIAYEVTDMADTASNELGFADWSILGLFVLPSRDLKAESSASAILLDVRNGYPYLTGSTFADKKGISTFMGQGGREKKLKDKARSIAVQQIAAEFAEGLQDLKRVADGVKLAEARQSPAEN
ncbi:hypothetical protein [Litorimonas sp. WD9-15]|uniref:hypothetical protein n=1 Tax=Litorimonas sp. WD9-15 TaxID=3418716 RepID=UPI003D046B9A